MLPLPAALPWIFLNNLDAGLQEALEENRNSGHS